MNACSMQAKLATALLEIVLGDVRAIFETASVPYADIPLEAHENCRVHRNHHRNLHDGQYVRESERIDLQAVVAPVVGQSIE